MQFQLYSFLPILLATTSAAYLLPDPPGQFNVTLTTGALIDHNRDGRALMLSIFQPAKCIFTEPVLYMPNIVAESEGKFLQRVFNISLDLTPLLREAQLPVCASNTGSACSPLNEAPVLLLDTGYRGTRFYYNHIASAIASEGFTVITMDHPGETNVIVYPDGRTEFQNLPNPTSSIDELTPLAYIRAADASFIVDQLSNATAITELLPARHHKFPTDRVVMVGHSLGGAAAVIAASQDPRIISAINWDGPFFESLPPEGLSSPVLYVASERFELKGEEDPRALAAWPQLKGPKLWVKISNLTHEGMFDFPDMIKAAGQDPAPLKNFLGSIPAEEKVKIMVAYATEWMKGAFAGVFGGPLLLGQEPETFPAVSVVRKENF